MEYKRDPYKLNITEKITRVACGNDFTACITVNGKLYAWGNNRWGNLGVENTKNDSNKNKIDSNKKMNDNENKMIVKFPTLVQTLSNSFVTQVKNIYNNIRWFVGLNI
jgi:alpha-tubulin suppressor-like RCC1 family protein